MGCEYNSFFFFFFCISFSSKHYLKIAVNYNNKIITIVTYLTFKLMQQLPRLTPGWDRCSPRGLSLFPKTQTKTAAGHPLARGGGAVAGPRPRQGCCIVLRASMLSMGLACSRGERLWENLRVSHFPRLLSQLNIAAWPTMGLKSKSNCCGGSILNYVFMNLHNGLSAVALLSETQAGNCERRWGKEGRRGKEGGNVEN